MGWVGWAWIGVSGSWGGQSRLPVVGRGVKEGWGDRLNDPCPCGGELGPPAPCPARSGSRKSSGRRYPRLPPPHAVAKTRRQPYDSFSYTHHPRRREELSLWAVSYAYFDGPRVFDQLARKIEKVSELKVTLLLNIHRGHGGDHQGGILGPTVRRTVLEEGRRCRGERTNVPRDQDR